MERIVVIGPPGAGKTDFAKELGSLLHIEPVIHLDEYFWERGWKKKTDLERDATVSDSIAGDQWIIEGNFQSTVGKLFSRADLVIWLNLSVPVCLYRVIRRHIDSSTKNEKLGPDSSWRDKLTLRIINSILVYKFTDANQIRWELHKKPALHCIELKNPQEVASFLEKIRLGFHLS